MATREDERRDCCSVDTAHLQQPGGESTGKPRWRRLLAVVPSVGAAVLPVGFCPACWPVYAGLLGSLGLGFLMETTFLLPLFAVLGLLALASLAHRARSRRGYGPFGFGTVGLGIALVGKFVLASTPLLYVGLATLVGASLWNSWPQKVCASGSRPKAVQPISGNLPKGLIKGGLPNEDNA